MYLNVEAIKLNSIVVTLPNVRRKQMKAFLFITGHFNDIDHTSSLIKALLERSHKVYLICLTQYNLDTDPRISLLRRFPNFQIHNFKALPRSIRREIYVRSNRALRTITNGTHQLANKIRQLS